jgi:hypothetical protein
MKTILPALDAHLRAGLSVKSFAMDHGYAAPQTVYYLARKMGFAPVMLAADEQRIIADLRNGRAAA